MGYYRKDGAFVDQVRRVEVKNKSRAGVEYTKYIDIVKGQPNPRMTNPWGNGAYMAKPMRTIYVFNKAGQAIRTKIKKKERENLQKRIAKGSNAEGLFDKVDAAIEAVDALEDQLFKFRSKKGAHISQIVRPKYFRTMQVPLWND